MVFSSRFFWFCGVLKCFEGVEEGVLGERS